MLSKCSILEPSLADWTSVQFSFRLQLRSWTVKSWKLKKFFEIPSNWQLKNQVKSESVSCQKHQTKRAPTIFLRILIFRAKLYFIDTNWFRWIFRFCQITYVSYVAKLNVICTNLCLNQLQGSKEINSISCFVHEICAVQPRPYSTRVQQIRKRK